MVLGSLFGFRSLRIISVILAVSILVACEPSEEARRQKQLQKEDNITPGEPLPKYDNKRYSITKKHGRFFLIPREYGGAGGRLVFYWPSKTPMTGRLDGKPYPEQNLEYDEKAIDIFIRADRKGNGGSKSMFENAERNGWILSHKTLRKGLDVVRLNAKAGVIKKEKSLYLATEMKWPDGRVPVVECSESLRVGGGWMPWREGVFLTIRFKYDKCSDWPEIYSEILHVMSQVKEVQ